MAKHQAGYRSTESETPGPLGTSNPTSVPPRPSAIVRTDARREVLDEGTLEAPALPRPPAAPRVSQFLRAEPRSEADSRGDSGTLTEPPKRNSQVAWAVFSLLVGFGGGLLVAWLVGFV